MTAPRILVWFWSGGGGGSQYAAQLARRLSMRFGAENVVLSMRAGDPTIATARAAGVCVRTANIVSSRLKPWASLAGIFDARRVLAEHARDVDVVIVAMNFAIAAPLAIGLSKPLVYCAHDPKPHLGDYETHMQRLTQHILLCRACAVVAMSGFAANALKDMGVNENKIHVAPLASVFEPSERPQQIGCAPVRLLFLGRMIEYKGAALLADSLPFIAHRDDWRRTVAGHGPALTPTLISRYAHWQVEGLKQGWLSEGEISNLLDQHDVILAPYLTASQSGVVAQAMAAGRPCVVTDVGGLAEQIGDGAGGWIVEEPKAESLAAVLAAVLDDPTQVQEKAKGAAKIARNAWHTSWWDWIGRPEGPSGRRP